MRASVPARRRDRLALPARRRGTLAGGMTANLWFDCGIVLVLILLNGFLALSELAVVSSRRSRLEAMANAGNEGARVALGLADDPGHFLSAVQVGITVIGLVAGAFSGTTIAGPLALELEAMGVADTISDALAYIPVVGVVTYLSVVVGELVPKQVALRHPERWAARVAPAMRLLTRAAWPLVRLLQASSRAVLNLAGRAPEARSRVTREEIKALIAEAERAGVVAPRAKAMMSGVIRLSDRSVRAIMTPRAAVEWLDLRADAATLRARLKATQHPRLPAAEGSLDHIAGVVHVKDLLDACVAGESPDVRALVREVPTVLDALDALRAMEALRKSGAHMLIVVDEYGAFQGVVTTTNILEAVAGTFSGPGALPPPAALRRADGSWLLDGDLPVDEMADALGLVVEPSRDYETVAGFVLAATGQIPRLGETFTYRRWRFEIIDLDGQRIDKVLATAVAAEA